MDLPIAEVDEHSTFRALLSDSHLSKKSAVPDVDDSEARTLAGLEDGHRIGVVDEAQAAREAQGLASIVRTTRE